MDTAKGSAMAVDEKATAPGDAAAAAVDVTDSGSKSDGEESVVLVDGEALDLPAKEDDTVKATPTAGTPTATKGGKAPAPPVPTPAAKVEAELAAMGFVDATMVGAVLAKHGADLDACARDLAAASEWDSLLDDLNEMGFHDTERNKTLMLKHSGNVKRTVKELVEEAA